MPSELDDFAERLVRVVRDRTILACDELARGNVGGPLGSRWKSATEVEACKVAILELIPDVVDQTLFHLLDAVDNAQLPLGWRRQDGSVDDLQAVGEGELGGWLMMGDGGWLDRFSTQRFFDPLADLDLDLESPPPDQPEDP